MSASAAQLPRVLIVDDDRPMCEYLEAALAPLGFAVESTVSPATALARLGAERFDVVATDLRMSDMSGLDLCQQIAATNADLPVVVITGFGSIENAIAAIRAGAYDFAVKPIEVEALALTLRRAAEHGALRCEVKALRRGAADRTAGDDLLGQSPALERVRDLVDRVADSEASVLISGESGTGKEVIARLLHRGSRRRSGPFLAINCAALPEALLESELFGHERGAFTDARAARSGLFAQASGGTLFLDEIAELPLGLQPKLLRALQDRCVRPLGGEREVPFDVRLIAATNADLDSLVEERRFREDLYFRIHVVRIELPPLRARGTDVLQLAQHFAARFAARAKRPTPGLGTGVAERLLSYTWPGNVRELQNCVERAIALSRGESVELCDLPESVRTARRNEIVLGGDDPSLLPPLDEVERRYIERVLEAVSGNKTLAARILRLDRKTLHRKLDRYARRGA